MKPILCADSETNPFERGVEIKPIVWGLFDGSEFCYFWSVEEMLDYLLKCYPDGATVYAHNGGRFDFYFLFQCLSDYGTKFALRQISGRIASLKVGKIEFRDSFCILPFALARYKKNDFDYNKLKGDIWRQHIPEMLSYLESDCVYLYDLVSAFVKEYGNKITVASAALAYYKKHFAPFKISPDKSSAEYDRLKPFYYGGRTECFAFGEINGPIHGVDINSAYPHAMLTPMPYGRSQIQDHAPPDNEIGRAFVCLSCVAKGCFPYRHDDIGLIFPSDNKIRDYRVSGWEYLAAVETGSITNVQIHHWIVCETVITFDKYVKHFYALKQQSVDGSPDYLFSKLFLNSLYGKFGIDPRRYRDTFIVHNDAITMVDREYCTIPGSDIKWEVLYPLTDDLTVVAKGDTKGGFLCLATAASITGYVRAQLFRVLNQTPGKLYCDTDSVYYKGDCPAPISKRLGDWGKLDDALSMVIIAKKTYGLDYGESKYTRSKGIPTRRDQYNERYGQLLSVSRARPIVVPSEVPTFSLLPVHSTDKRVAPVSTHYYGSRTIRRDKEKEQEICRRRLTLAN